jgi:hypothetical protein
VSPLALGALLACLFVCSRFHLLRCSRSLNASGVPGAALCKKMCCGEPNCVRWTFTDPQPGAPDHKCWLKGGAGDLINFTGSSGHVWSGSVAPPSPPPPPPPPPPQCNTTSILNNTDSNGAFVGQSPYKLNPSTGESGAQQCRDLCCATTGCFGWTFTDPQPNDSGGDNDCWLKDATTSVFPSSCGDGHCWSGIPVEKPPPGPLTPVRRPLSVMVVGVGSAMNVTDAIAGLDDSTTADAIVDLCVALTRLCMQ